MAEVFRATEPRSAGEPRTVVVKRMLPAIASEPGARQMFEAEADLGALIKHENVVHVLGYGEADGQPFLALEYVRGVDLWRLFRFLTRNGLLLGVPLTLYVLERMLAGLQAVHEATDSQGRPLGVIHRDVSPGNVLLSMHGEVKLGDLGIARARLQERYPQASSGERAKGKLGYLSPEQVQGAELDPRSDVFSAGIVAAELLMGRTLFSGGSELAVLLAIRDAKIGPFLEIKPRLPAGVGDVVVRALAREPGMRFQSAKELCEAFAKHASGDENKLREELEKLVVRAMASANRLDSGDEVTSQIEVDPMIAQPSRVPSKAGRASANPTLPPPPETTGDVPKIGYRVRTKSGAELGPFQYAQLVEQLTVGKLRPDDEIAEGDGAFRPIDSIAELRRHLPPSLFSEQTKDRQAPDAAIETISLGGGGIARALFKSATTQATGLWLCEIGEVRKELYVKNGAPEFVTSNRQGELLGESLVSRGVITRGELDMALAVMPRFEGRLGDTLAALGLVEPLKLFQHIALQVREKLLEIFTWTDGTAQFYGGVTAPHVGFPMNLDPFQILEEGMRRRVEAGLERARFAKADTHRLRLAPAIPTQVEKAPLSAQTRLVLAELAMPRYLPELNLLAKSHGHPDAKGSVALLLMLDAIQWD